MLVSAVVFLVKIYVQCGLVDAVLLLYRFFIRFHKIEPVKDAIGQDEARKELKLCRCVVFHTSKVRTFDTQTYLQVYVYVTLCHGSLQVSQHFFELGKEYMAVMLVIIMLPVFVTLFEQLLAYTADNLVSKLTPNGAYDHDDHILRLAVQMIDDCQNMDLADAVVAGIPKVLSGIVMAAIGSFFACAYNYVMHIFVATRYLMVLMMELVGPIAIVCLLNNDTRSSFFTWMKGMFGIFMLYPGFIMASVFADEYTANLISNSVWPAFVLVIFSFILKLTLLATVKSMVNKWL